MNHLSIDKKVKVLSLLVEGVSMRAASRITGVSINTITTLLVKTGKACAEFHDLHVRNVKAQRLQCDEVWAFILAKEKKAAGRAGAGDCWTWIALCADSKLAVSWYTGERDAQAAEIFIADVYSRLNHTKIIQLSTDGLHAYREPVGEHWGSQIDFAQLVKSYGTNPKQEHNKSDTAIRKEIISGKPDEKHISTSFIERKNLTLRMHNRRFTRKTNAHSKKLENHCHALALHMYFYNWVRRHQSIRVTPAMEAGLIHRFMTLEEIVNISN